MAILLCGITACKKDKDAEPALSAIGTWRPAETDEQTLKYVIIGEDGYEHILNSLILDLHTKNSYAYTADEEQIFLNGSYFNGGGYFKYKVSNDSLYLQAPGFYKVLLRENNPPDMDTWIRKVEFTPQYSLSFIANYGPLEWTGTEFIIQSAYIPKRFYKYNTTTQQTYDSIDIAHPSFGFCYHNGNIWVNNFQNDNMLHTVNFATGNYSFSSVSNGTKVIVPSSDGNKIWSFSNDNKMYSYNDLANVFTEEGTLAQPFFTAISSGGLYGADMAIKDGYAYWALGNLIGKFSLTTFRFVETYEITNGGAAGIAYDGTDFWINGGNDLQNLSIGKVNLP